MTYDELKKNFLKVNLNPVEASYSTKLFMVAKFKNINRGNIIPYTTNTSQLQNIFLMIRKNKKISIDAQDNGKIFKCVYSTNHSFISYTFSSVGAVLSIRRFNNKTFKINGECMYNSSTVRSIMHYNNGVKSGIWKSFFIADGRMLNFRKYDKNGVLVKEILYHPNGQMHTKSTRIGVSNEFKKIFYDSDGHNITYLFKRLQDFRKKISDLELHTILCTPEAQSYPTMEDYNLSDDLSFMKENIFMPYIATSTVSLSSDTNSDLINRLSFDNFSHISTYTDT